MPGVLAGSLLVFAIAIGSYVVPALMGGWKVLVLPIHIYQQVSEVGNWRFGAAIAVILFVSGMLASLRLPALRHQDGGRSPGMTVDRGWRARHPLPRRGRGAAPAEAGKSR